VAELDEDALPSMSKQELHHIAVDLGLPVGDDLGVKEVMRILEGARMDESAIGQ
jgi:hypothetical protein